MNYDYLEARKENTNPYVYIRLKYEKKYYRCEYYDGMRILYDSIPQGKFRYETRHSDYDICFPVAIVPEGEVVIVNFCGTIVSDIPIQIAEEKKIMEIWYEDSYYKEYFKNSIYNPI